MNHEHGHHHDMDHMNHTLMDHHSGMSAGQHDHAMTVWCLCDDVIVRY